MKLSQKSKRNLPAEIIRIVENNDFLPMSDIANLDITYEQKGMLLSLLFGNPPRRFFVLDGMIYLVRPKLTNKKYAEVIPWARLRARAIEERLKDITPYETLETFRVASDIARVCINGLAVPMPEDGSDGWKTVEIRKDHTAVPRPKASCYVESRVLFPVNHKVTVSFSDCELTDVRTITNVDCIWLCGSNKVYIYVKSNCIK